MNELKLAEMYSAVKRGHRLSFSEQLSLFDHIRSLATGLRAKEERYRAEKALAERLAVSVRVLTADRARLRGLVQLAALQRSLHSASWEQWDRLASTALDDTPTGAEVGP